MRAPVDSESPLLYSASAACCRHLIVLEKVLIGAHIRSSFDCRSRDACDLGIDDLERTEADEETVRGTDAEHLRNAPSIV
jgi:hypothetical protein